MQRYGLLWRLRAVVILTAVVGLVAAAVVKAGAKEFPVNDQEQTNILGICDVAAQSPMIGRDVRAIFANFCVTWQRRMEQSNVVPPPAAAPPVPVPPLAPGQIMGR